MQPGNFVAMLGGGSEVTQVPSGSKSVSECVAKCPTSDRIGYGGWCSCMPVRNGYVMC